MPDKIATFGAKFYKTSIASANEIGNLIELGEINLTRPTVDSTTHADAVRTKLPGVWDSGELTIKIAYDPQDADHIALYTTDTTGSSPHTAIPTWVFTVPSNATNTKKMSGTFTAFIDSFQIDPFPVDGLQTATIKFALSGVLTLAPDDVTSP